MRKMTLRKKSKIAAVSVVGAIFLIVFGFFYLISTILRKIKKVFLRKK